MICAVPAATPVARPVLEIVATAGASELQVAEAVTSWVLPSENVPVSVNCCVAPAAKLDPLGLMATETSVAAVTTIVDCPVMPASCASMLAVPCETPVASPAGVTDATCAFEVVHVTRLLKSSELPSE